MKKFFYLIILLLIVIPNSFSQRHISSNEDGTAYIPLKLYRSVLKKNISKKDFKNLKIDGHDTLILIKDFEKFKSKMEKSTSFKSESRAYMDLKSYKKRYNKPLTHKDSLNFKFRDNDTLVLVEGYKPKGVSVPYEDIDSTLLEIYKDIVYKKYHFNSEKEKRKKIYMTLWTEPIKIYFSKSLDKEYKKVISDISSKISKEIDSLNLTIVTKLEDSNYVIYQIDENSNYKYSKQLSKNKYIDYYSYWNKSKIYDTKLEINTTNFKNKKINEMYLTRVFIKSLGQFYNTSKLPCESVFSNCNGRKIKFGDLDMKLLKYHYSYGICKRTPLETFEENHEKAKETFLKTGRPLHFIHID